MFASRTLLMTAAVLSFGFAGSAQAAGLLTTNGGVGVNTPVANVGANTNVNTGVTSHDYESHTLAGVNADGSVNSRNTERSATTEADGTVTTRHRTHTRHSANTQADVDADAKVYNDESVRNDQMREDMNDNDGVHAGVGVRTRANAGLND
jgi:hypothetical protein